jgi:hypothetical protein
VGDGAATFVLQFCQNPSDFTLEILLNCASLVLFNNEQINGKNDMPKHGSIKTKNGASVLKNAKAHFGDSHANGYIHVISPATASEIRRAVGIKKSDTATVLRVFANIGVKV